MKQKVGILTLYYHNYNMGGMLQAYALQKVIAKEGFDVEQICYQYRDQKPHVTIKEKIRSIFLESGIIGGIIIILKRIVLKIINNTIGIKEANKIKRRISRYQKFEMGIPHSERIYTSDNITESLDNYNIFVCGGDQIWNDWGDGFDKRYPEIFTLLFVDDSKRKCSYSASTGQSSLSEEFLYRLRPGIDKLDAISVRERSSLACINKITDKKADVVVDPVLLLDETEWAGMEYDDELIKAYGSYVFCYILGNDLNVKKCAQKFAHKHGLKLLIFPYTSNRFNWRDLFWGDIRDFDSGPAEFVQLIRNAKAIITNSYHAMVFSVIFHKPFYIFERSTVVGGDDMNMRITDFLKEYGLEDCLTNAETLNNKKEIDSIDYTYTDSVLKKAKGGGRTYLKKSLGL